MFFHSFIYRKKSFLLLFFISVSSFSQQIGDGFAPILPDFTVPNKSGMYNGLNPIGGISDNTYSGWQHLILVRHPNENNDHQLQIASSFTTNDRLFFRKLAGGLNSKNPDWLEIATRGSNIFLGNQHVSGLLKIQNPNGGNYNENMRLMPSPINDYASLVLGAVPGDSGSGEGQWTFVRYPQANNYMFSLRYFNTDFVNILNNGNVGIGTATPVTKLDVRGIISTPEIAFRNADGGDDSDPYRLRKVQGSSNVNWLELQLNDDFNESFRIYGNSCVGFGCGEYSGNLYHSFDAGGNVFHSGNVGIGTTTPAHKLDVIGTIRSREVKVDMNGADFVFEEKYPLMPLSELETYIKKNKHLPEIAPAKEMQEQGSNLGDLNTKLLQKIEELTLYVIDIKKENETLKQKYEGLEKRMNKQKK